MVSGMALEQMNRRVGLRTYYVQARVRNRTIILRVQAETRAHVFHQVQHLLFPFEPIIEKVHRFHVPFRYALRDEQKSDLFTALYEYLESSLSVYQALIEYGTLVSSPFVAGLVLQMASYLADGRSLAEALMESGEFSSVDVEVIRAAEQTGTLTEALLELARTYRRTAELRRSMRQLTITPVTVGLGLLMASTVYRFFLVPAYVELMRAFQTEPPTAVRLFCFLYDTSPAVIGVMLLSLLWYRRRGRWVWTETRERWLKRLPFLWSILLNRDLVRAYTVFYHALRSGLSPSETYRMMKESVRLPTLYQSFERLLASVESPRSLWFGRSPGDVLRSAPGFPERDAGLINVGCSSGALERMVERLLLYRMNTLEQAIREFLRILEPAMIFLLGLMVLATTLLFYGPFFDLINRVQ